MSENNQTNDTNKKKLPRWSYYVLAAVIFLLVVIVVLVLVSQESSTVTPTEKKFGETFNVSGLDLTVDNFSCRTESNKVLIEFQVTMHNPTSKTIKFDSISSGLYYMFGHSNEPARYNPTWSNDYSQWEIIPYDTQTGAFRFYVPTAIIPWAIQDSNSTFTQSKSLGFEFRFQENKQDAKEYFFVFI